MDIYTDYGNWKFENHEFISNLVKNKSKTISRFTPVITVVDYLYDKVCDNKKLSEDEEVIFSSGFDYIYDQFHFIQTLLQFKFNNDYKKLEKNAKTINLLLFINEFIAEALNYKNINTKELDELESKVNAYLDKDEVVPDEYFAILDDITAKMFEANDIEVHTTDQIFYEIALELGIYKDDDYNIYNEILNNQISKTRNK